MQTLHIRLRLALLAAALAAVIAPALAEDRDGGRDEGRSTGLPSHARLQAALRKVVSDGTNGGFALNMWATVVNRDGVVGAVAFSGQERGDQWPGSRVIS